jgi:hypothetical protein
VSSAIPLSAGGFDERPRFVLTLTLLPDGKALVAGGPNGSSVLASAELYELGHGSR